MKRQAIADILIALSRECERLNDLHGAARPTDEQWESVRVILRACDAIGEIRAEDVDHARLDRINSQGGALSWCGRSFAEHPDRCRCQGDDPIPHRHYDHAPFSCARCGHENCAGYVPAV